MTEEEIEQLRVRCGITAKQRVPYRRRPECQARDSDGRKCRMHAGHQGDHVAIAPKRGRLNSRLPWPAK